jgi:nucleotide-binding universal stress UspA family protein
MKILLAIDGSPCSETAVREVARRAWSSDTVLRIISAYSAHFPLAAEPMFAAFSDRHESLEYERRRAQLVVERALATLHEYPATNTWQITTEVIEGAPKPVIIAEAERWAADLLVLGSHGYGAMGRLLLGTVSQAVAANAACSVLIVRGPH